MGMAELKFTVMVASMCLLSVSWTYCSPSTPMTSIAFHVLNSTNSLSWRPDVRNQGNIVYPFYRSYEEIHVGFSQNLVSPGFPWFKARNFQFLFQFSNVMVPISVLFS